MNCLRCGKTLSNPKSVGQKYGPICWKKEGKKIEKEKNIPKEVCVL